MRADIGKLAAKQLREYDSRSHGSEFTEEANFSLEQAYELQTAVADLRRQRGEKQIGYKVGCTSPIIRAQLGIDHSISGHLWESERRESGCSLLLSAFVNPAIEGELAVVLANDLCGNLLSDSEISSAISDIFLVIELHNAVFQGETPAAAKLIASNAMHAGFVVGTTRSKFRQLDSAQLSIQINGAVVESYTGPDLTDGIIQSLRWLTGHLARDGRSLHKGQTVLTGSLPKLIPVATTAKIHITTSHFGEVTAEFVGS